MPKWGLWVLLGLTLVIVLSSSFAASDGGEEISYSEFMAEVRDGDVERVEVDNTNGDISGELADGTEFRCGTGFTDRQRETPPPVGSVVTVRYFELTPAGVPRFPAFLTVRDYE